MEIRVTKVVGIEWYDGWIAALVDATDATFLCFAVAINPDQGDRVFAMCKLPRKLADDIAATLGQDEFSPELVSLWRLALCAKAIYITRTDLVVGSLVTVVPANNEQIMVVREYKLPVAETVFSDRASRYWFDS